jgi:hypothetical protein
MHIEAGHVIKTLGPWLITFELVLCILIQLALD